MSNLVQRNPQPSTPKAALLPLTTEPTLREAIVFWAASALLFVITAATFENYFQLFRNFGDSSAYMQIADAIRTWNFSGVQAKHFWGLPYAVAALGKLTGLSSLASLLVVCAASSLAAVILAHRLWGGWIALFFALLNFDWLQRSFLGGSEPLFVALIFASFLAVREKNWKWAALLASLATITRPLGICLLIGIGVALLRGREWRKLVSTVAIALLIGFLYVIPLRLYLHDALATVHSYGVLHTNPYPPLFGIPFRAIIVGTLQYPAPVTNLLISFGWIFLVVAGTIAMFTTATFRGYAASHFAEATFVALYLLSLYSYNLPVWARSNFARFAIPILPFIFLALYRWLPKDRRAIWVLAVVAPMLAAISAVGLENVMGMLRSH